MGLPPGGVHSARLYDIVARGDLGRAMPNGVLRRFKPTGFDGELLAIADAAVASRVPTALVLPIAGTTSGALLASAMLVAHFAHAHTLTAQVALVTKQLQLRAFFDTLYFRRLSIVDYFPRTVVARDGSISDVGMRPPEFAGKPGRLHFVSDIDGLGNEVRGHLHGIVIEAHPTHERGLHQLLRNLAGKVPIIYVTLDPADPLIDLFAEAGAVWAWDAPALSVLVSDEPNSDAVCAEAVLLRATSHTCYEIAGPPESTRLDAALACLWDDLVTIQHHPGSLTFEAVGWVWGIFGTLSHLVVPVESYDRYARGAWSTTPLVDAAGKAEAYARNALCQEDSEYWQLLANDVDEAVQAARSSNPKPKGLADWVKERVDRGHRDSAIGVRNRASRLAVADYLQERPDVPLAWEQFVRITSFPDLVSGRAQMGTGEVLYTGPLASSYAGLLALPTAKRLTVLAHGPWEVSRAVRQVQSSTGRLAELAHGETRISASQRLFAGRKIYREVDRVAARLVLTGLSVPAGIPSTAREALWNPFDVRVTGLVGRIDSDSEGPAQHAPPGQSGEVAALRIDFQDGIGFFEPAHIVSRLADGELADVAAKSLSSGHRVVLVERGARRDLFDVIVEKLERLPEFEATVMLIHEWHERARRAGYESGLSTAEILDRMRPEASITSPQTIGTWIRGVVHGPLRAEDIRHFGRAVGDEFLQARWEAVGRALTTFRAHRRRVGHMLAKVLNGMAPAELEDAGYFDRRLGIHYSDLTEALSVHMVKKCEQTPVMIGYQYVNRLLSVEETKHIDAICRLANT